MQPLATKIYMVERKLPNYTQQQLAAAQKAALAASEIFTRAGRPIRYIRSTFVPADAHCMCLFEASDPTDIIALNRVAEIPFTRIIEVQEMTPVLSAEC